MKRLESLDALRGFDMIWILGLEWTVRGLCRLIPGWEGGWLDHQVRHVAWDGLAFFDTIFPLFIFIAGVSFPFSYVKQRERGDSSLKIHLKIFRRTAILILLGIVYNGFLAFDFRFESFRYASVLGKVGLAWMVAALLCVHVGLKTRVGVFVGLILGYWALLHLVAPDAPPGSDPYSLAGCFPGYLDRLGFTPGGLICKLNVNGMMKPWLEPSGIVVSVLGSSATAILGTLAGDVLRAGRFSPARKSALLAAGGGILLALGLLVSLECPICKNLWSPSFTLVVGGYSALMLALFHWIVDVKGHDRWCFFLKVVGVNSIAIYMLKRIVDYKAISHFLFGGVAGWFADPLFVESLGMFVLCWLTCWFLHRQKIYLKV